MRVVRGTGGGGRLHFGKEREREREVECITSIDNLMLNGSVRGKGVTEGRF